MISRATLLLVGLLAAAAQALPTSPATLWDLTRDAQLIVVARVGARRPMPCFPRTYEEASRGTFSGVFHEDLIQLQVLQTIVGPNFQELEVATVDGIACPAPARLVADCTVLAFLSQSGTEWHVIHLSYGALYPTDVELPAFVARVRAAVTLQRGHPTEAEVKEWLVGTAEDPATRWHGLYPLASSFDDHFFYDHTRDGQTAELSAAQRARLAAAFITFPTTDVTLGMSIALLSGLKNPALDQAFVGAFETALGHEDASGPELWSALHPLLERFASAAEVHELLGPQKGYVSDLTVTKVEKAWRAARERIPIPKGTRVVPAERPAVRGTGSDTPF